MIDTLEGCLMRSAAWSMSLGRSSLILAMMASLTGAVDSTALPAMRSAAAAGESLPGRLVYQTRMLRRSRPVTERLRVRPSWAGIDPTGFGAMESLTENVIADGSKLAYAGEGALWVTEPNQSPSLAIWASAKSHVTALAWSPSGDRLAFATDDSSSPGPPKSVIHILAADVSGDYRIASGDNIHSLAWSPDSARLAFTQNQGDIWAVPATGGRRDRDD